MAPSRVAPMRTRMWVPEVGPVPSKTSSRPMYILTGRLPLARESRQARGFHVDRGLAPEAAADLDGVHADLGDRVAQQLRELVADAEVRLGC